MIGSSRISTVNSILYSSKYPSKSRLKSLVSNEKLNGTVSDDDLDNLLLRISISIDTLRRTDIRQVAKFTLDSLVAEIGNFLGMFLGMSILSLFELVDLLVSIAYTYYDKLALNRSNFVIRMAKKLCI